MSSTPTDPPKLEDKHRIFGAAFNAGDLDVPLALFEPNAIMRAAPEQLARSGDEIRAALAGFLAARSSIHVQTTAAFETADGVALTHAKWTMKGPIPDGSPFEMVGATAEVLRRQPDGRWLYVVDNPFAS